jgi:hypothetical protein
MINKLLNVVYFVLAIVLGLLSGGIMVLGILYSIPKVTEKLEYYD